MSEWRLQATDRLTTQGAGAAHTHTNAQQATSCEAGGSASGPMNRHCAPPESSCATHCSSGSLQRAWCGLLVTLSKRPHRSRTGVAARPISTNSENRPIRDTRSMRREIDLWPSDQPTLEVCPVTRCAGPPPAGQHTPIPAQYGSIDSVYARSVP